MEDSLGEQLNHKNTTLVIAAIVAAVAMTGAAFALPQQAIAHYGHHHHYSNSIDVNQNISQANLCSDSLCVNDASNSAEIHRGPKAIKDKGHTYSLHYFLDIQARCLSIGLTAPKKLKEIITIDNAIT